MKVLIIGSGVIGVCTAYCLANAGHSVTVVERHAEPGMGASFANGGLLTPSMADPWNAPGTFGNLLRWIGRRDAPMLLRPRALPHLLGWGIRFIRNSSPARFAENLRCNLRLAQYSLAVLREIQGNIPMSFDQTSVGSLMIFRSREGFEAAVRRNQELRSLGLCAEPVSDRGRLIDLEPALKSIGSQLAGGIYYPDDRSGDARLFSLALARHAQQLGVRFLFDTDVIGISATRNRVTSIGTASEELVADAYIIAAGAYSTPLLRSIGINVPLAPAKGYSITITRSEQHTPPQMPVIDHDLHAAVTPMGRSLRIAGTAEFDGLRADIRPTRVQTLVGLFQRLYPHHPIPRDRCALNEWMGFRPMSADGVPIIGHTPIENLYLNTGHGHLGWTMAAGSGRVVSDLVNGSSPQIDVEPYALRRFQ
ncbi:MAG: D-amino acid dehydrogenase [Steroidobacteraceae bacterium]